MKFHWIVLVLLTASPAGVAAAPHVVDPDWPCQQVKVGDLSVAAFWNGPAVDDTARDWRKDAAAAALVGQVVQRRLKLDEAGARIAAFAQAAGDAKHQHLTALFAGVFDVLSQERGNVMNGLDRFSKRQKVLADNLRHEGEQLRTAQTSTPPDETRVAELTQRLTWDTQVFEQRRQSLRFACDVPTVIEQRLYSLGKLIQQNLN